MHLSRQRDRSSSAEPSTGVATVSLCDGLDFLTIILHHARVGHVTGQTCTSRLRKSRAARQALPQARPDGLADRLVVATSRAFLLKGRT